MCGIYGTTLPYTEEQVRKKLERTQFRGPDQQGVTTFKNEKDTCVFGHNRLSILDLDSRSNQPFTYLNQVHLVFNGEIYNFLELREVLTKKGYSFSTTSDTEVICAAYLEYGNDCVQHFNGMFAFVIYDLKKRLLFGAKDRLGQKPFYYYLNNQGFEFASQISSIQMFNDGLSVNKKTIQSYLIWNTVPHPDSIFNEVKKLRDGHAFTYDLQTKNFKDWSYWDIVFPIAPSFRGNFEQAKLNLEDLLTDAVKKRMIADVPLGVFLSGGVDSSLIAALASKSATKKIKTFSVKFNEKGFDESIYAKKVANHLQTDHHVIECDYEEGLDLITNFSHYYDEPFADSSAIPSMLLAKHTKPHVTVALSGDGADEAFLGYRRYGKLEKVKQVAHIPYVFRVLGMKILSVVQKNRHQGIKDIVLAKSVGEAYLRMMAGTSAPWLPNSHTDITIPELKYLFNTQKGSLECCGDFDLKTYLSWDINTKVDRATMAYSLEARSPFLDYRVVEMAQKLPTEFKYQKGFQKRILKEILFDYVPKEYFDRQKSGFGMPLAIWFRNELKELVLSELSLKNLSDIPGIHPQKTRNMIKSHIDGSWNHSSLIWKLLVLKQWMKTNGSGLSLI